MKRLCQRPLVAPAKLLRIALFFLFLGLVVGSRSLHAQEGQVRAAVSDPTWQGAYWNNGELAGPPTLQRSDAQLDFTWGNGSPDPTLNADRFSARWTRYLYLEAGLYRFSATSDDGVRVFINDQRIIDGWSDHGEQTFTANVQLSTGHHLVRVEYYESSGLALLRLAWTQVSGQTPQPANWRAEFFNNRDLVGSPVVAREDREINFDWGGGAPATGVNADGFSARWTRTLDLPAGNYRFRLTVDDGARLWVNNALIIDQWRDQVATTHTSDIYLPGGATPLRLEYYDSRGGAVLRLAWERTDQSAAPAPTARWRGEYFNNTNFTGPAALVREDENIDFDWGGGAPGIGVNADNFAVRWVRTVDFPAGIYRFRVRLDDGARLWVNNQLLLDQWRLQEDSTYLVEMTLPGGAVSLTLEYFDAGGAARIRLWWERVDQPTAPVNSQWRGEYFNNRELGGAPVLTRNEEQVNFGWGLNSPAPGVVNVDQFSARWVRTVDLPAGRYRFRVTVDDGARLWVNNQLLIDQWRQQSETSYSAEFVSPGGQLPIRLEYYEESGGALVRLAWERIDPPLPTPISVPGPTATPAPSSGQRWRGEYFNNSELRGAPAFTRDDRLIDFTWGTDSPAPGVVNNDNFSVRWTITLDFSGGRYRFSTETDDGVRLYIDDKLLIDQWRTMPTTRFNTETSLSKGSHTLRLEYFDQSGSAVVRLGWRKLANQASSVGNIVTCVPPQPANYAWIKLYRLDNRGNWYPLGRGIGSSSANGYLKIDGLTVDVARFGNRGEPYRVEQWINGRVARSVGNTNIGEPEFRVRAAADNLTPWQC